MLGNLHVYVNLQEGITDIYIYIWLVVSTPLKNIHQWEGLSLILWKIKNVPNHQPDIYWHGMVLLGWNQDC